MPVDPTPSLTQISTQYPLIGAIIILVFVFLWYMREERKDAREERKDERQARSEEQSKMRDFISIQNELFLQSVKEIREQNNAAMSRLADEIKSISTEVTKVSGMLTAHDARAQERNASQSRIRTQE